MATLFGCHGNVPWQIGKYGTYPSSTHKALSYSEKLAKICLVCPEIFNEIRLFFWPYRNRRFQMSSIISGVTRQKFINFLHDIATSSPLLTLTFRRWYCNSFTNDSAKNESGISRHSWHFPKINIDCHDNIHRQIGKQGTDLSSALKALSYGEKIVKIGPVYHEIFD